MPKVNPSKTMKSTVEMKQVVYPGENVMLGRGGESNHHKGNTNFRILVEKFQARYKKACKQDKPKIAREVVQSWRGQDPPGRFLIRADKGRSDSNWHDVGDLLALKRATKTLGEKPQRERRAVKAAKSMQGRVQVSASNVAVSGAHVATREGIGSELFRSISPYDITSFASDAVFSRSLMDQEDCAVEADLLDTIQMPQPCENTHHRSTNAALDKLGPLSSKTSDSSAAGSFYESYIKRKQKQYGDDDRDVDFSTEQHRLGAASTSAAYGHAHLMHDFAASNEGLPTAAELVNGLFEDDTFGGSF